MSGYLDKLREHEFDGIQEFDNYLPRWWLWSFYLACIFSVVYWLYYHGTSWGPSAVETYNAEQKRLLAIEMAKKPVDRQMLLEYAKQPDAQTAGKELFVAVCASCHNADGSGNVGPNLTDNAWLHGSRVEDIYKVIAEGVTGKAMVAWLPTLKREKCMQLAVYIHTSLRNKNLPGRAPEGKVE